MSFQAQRIRIAFELPRNDSQGFVGPHHSIVCIANCIHSTYGNILQLSCYKGIFYQTILLFVFKCTVYYIIVKVCTYKPVPQIHPWDIEREPPPSIGM